MKKKPISIPLTLKALKYEDSSRIDFALTDGQRWAFRESVAQMDEQTGENWNGTLTEVEVQEDEEFNITYKGNRYAPSDDGSNYYTFAGTDKDPVP